jgi:hypothetical protein
MSDLKDNIAVRQGQPKAISFRVEWDDGSVWTADGITAEAVMEWYHGCEVMSCIHGAVYSGPQITVTPHQVDSK